jgi:hypothetical protein
MMIAKAEEIARLVEDRLRREPSTDRVKVVADEVRLEPEGQDVWLAPVAYQQDVHSAYQYFDAFTRIEEELEEKQICVLLVPRILPPPSDRNT